MRRFGKITPRPSPRLFATLLEAECIGDAAPTPGELRPTHSVLSAYCDTQVEVRSFISGNNLIRSSDVLFATFAVDVDIAYYWSSDCEKPCLLVRARVSRRFVDMPLLPCPRRFTAPLWADRNKDGVPCIGKSAALVGFTIHCDTGVRGVIVFWTTTSYERAVTFVPSSSSKMT